MSQPVKESDKAIVAIAYYSANGTTKTAAEAIAAGIEAGGKLQGILIPILGTDIVEGRYRNREALEIVDRADALVMGSPTYMGGPAAQFKAFADASSQCRSRQSWDNKWAAGFTVGSNSNGELSNTLSYFWTLAQQHNMYWIGMDIRAKTCNRLGSALGLSVQALNGKLQALDLQAARALGARVANTVQSTRQLI